MHFCVLHLEDRCGPCCGEEEVYVVAPGGSKTAIAVPLDALPAFLPLLESAIGGAEHPRCPACEAPIPKLPVCPETHSEGGDPG